MSTMSVAQDSPQLARHSEAARLEASGLDIIVVHGVKTVGVQDLPRDWAKTVSQVAPQNSAVFSFDVNINVGEGFIWQTFAQHAAALLDAIVQGYHRNADRRSRALFFIGYALGGLIIKNTAGLIFLATPHPKDASAVTRQTFAGILRHIRTSKVQTLIKETSLEDLATCCRRFTDLNLHCRILSCWEQVEVKKPLPLSRRMQVNAARVPSTLEYANCGEKSSLLDTIRDFMKETSDDIENGKDSIPRGLIQNDWVEIASSMPLDECTSVDSQSRTAKRVANAHSLGPYSIVPSTDLGHIISNIAIRREFTKANLLVLGRKLRDYLE
ncbi:MAG: hypothetical protein Q9214_001742 [Letrouitia sp. 1 TL-2023]